MRHIIVQQLNVVEAGVPVSTEPKEVDQEKSQIWGGSVFAQIRDVSVFATELK